MAEVYVVEVPGGERQAWQCPYCSKMYPTQDEEARKLECPNICRRCGAPMDVAKANAFENARAAEVAGPARPRAMVHV